MYVFPMNYNSSASWCSSSPQPVFWGGAVRNPEACVVMNPRPPRPRSLKSSARLRRYSRFQSLKRSFSFFPVNFPELPIPVFLPSLPRRVDPAFSRAGMPRSAAFPSTRTDPPCFPSERPFRCAPGPRGRSGRAVSVDRSVSAAGYELPGCCWWG